MPAIRVNSIRPATSGSRNTKSTAISARKPASAAKKLAGVRSSSQRLRPTSARSSRASRTGSPSAVGDFGLAAACRHALGEVLGVVGHHVVDLRWRQAARRRCKVSRNSDLVIGLLLMLLAVGADRTRATAAVKVFHSAFWLARAAWPALVSW